MEEDDAAGEHPVPEGTRSETVLVVADDDDVRAYSVEVLRGLGYRVLEAHDGASALRPLERQEGRVDLLFSDVVLPSGLTRISHTELGDCTWRGKPMLIEEVSQ